MDERDRRNLDAEEEERLVGVRRRVFEEGQAIKATDVFRHKRVFEALNENRTIIPSYDLTRALSALPFHDSVILVICPACADEAHLPELLPLLDTGFIIPALRGPYHSYSRGFTTAIIGYPHLSDPEFSFWRTSQIRDNAERVHCHRCFDDHCRETLGILGDPGEGSFEHSLVETTYGALAPPVGSDLELAQAVREAAVNRDTHRLEQLRELAEMIRSIRTASAFGATQQVPLELLEYSITHSDEYNLPPLPPQVDDVRRMAQEGLGLIIPKDMPPGKLVSVILENRSEIRKVVNGLLIDSAQPSGQVSRASLIAGIADLNEEIRKAHGSKRFEYYQAAVGFMRGNKALLASALLAGALGVAGSMLGCGLSLVGGSLLTGLDRSGKIDLDLAEGGVQRLIHQSLEPSVRKLLSRYLDMSLDSVNLWRIREELSDGA